ncbi:hypothetical protein FOZ62_000075 [Perkinsus olseni]|nr:hypothetical protein FOZ62_000075 [Perkinsus olseni]
MMTIIGRSPLLMLFALPSFEAVRSSGGDQEVPEVGAQTVDFKDLSASGATFNISHVNGEEGTTCHLEWSYFDPGRACEDLDLYIHLDTEQKVFNYIQANSGEMHMSRDVVIRDNKDELIVKAYSHHPAEDGWRYPTMKVKAGQRSKAEKKLGPYSPLGHLKGDVLDPLITTINWERDSEQVTCERIYHFIAFHAPEGYVNKTFDWLFDFVDENADRVEKAVRQWSAGLFGTIRKKLKR